MNFQELSWEEAACLTLQKSKKLFSSAEEILQYISSSNLKSNFNEIDRRSLEAILLCLSRGSACKLVVSSRKLNGHSRETLRFALKEYVDSHMFHFVDVDLTDAELELVKLNGLLPSEHLPKDNSKKSLCVIKAPYLSQYLEKKITKSRNNSLQNGQVKPSTKLSKTTNCVNESKNTSTPVNNTNTKYFQLLQSPNSPLVTANLKCLVNETIFDDLPSHIQDDLLNFLPDCDDSVSQLLNNEFFSSALETFRNHLADGLFTSSDFSETVIAPESEPPLKQLISESPNEDEHYNITAVSPTKIRIAKRSLANEPVNKSRSSKDSAQNASDNESLSSIAGKLTPTPTSSRRSGAVSTAAPLLQNERVTALRKTTKSGRVIKTNNPALLDPKPTYNTRSQRLNGYPSLKTKSSQQAILHSARSKTNDGKPKRTAASGGKPSVRFTIPPPPLSPWPKPCNSSTISTTSTNAGDHQSVAEQGTRTLASAKLIRKRKMHSYSLNRRWQPAVNVHSKWIHLSDDEPFPNDCFPIYPVIVGRQPSKTSPSSETSRDDVLPTDGVNNISPDITLNPNLNGGTTLPHNPETSQVSVHPEMNSTNFTDSSAHKNDDASNSNVQSLLPESLPLSKQNSDAEAALDKSSLSASRQIIASDSHYGLETQVSHSSISSDLVNTNLSSISVSSPSVELPNGFGPFVNIDTFMINSSKDAVVTSTHTNEGQNGNDTAAGLDSSVDTLSPSQQPHLVATSAVTTPSVKSPNSSFSVSSTLVSSFSNHPKIDFPSYQHLNKCEATSAADNSGTEKVSKTDSAEETVVFLQERRHLQASTNHAEPSSCGGNDSLAGTDDVSTRASSEIVVTASVANSCDVSSKKTVPFTNDIICEHIDSSDRTKSSCPPSPPLPSTVASSDNNNQLNNSTDTAVAAYAFDNDKSSNFANN